MQQLIAFSILKKDGEWIINKNFRLLLLAWKFRLELLDLTKIVSDVTVTLLI